MNEANVFIGAYCPKCNVTIGLAASVGGAIKCPSCGGEMIEKKNSPETHVIANATCNKCNTKISLMSVVGGPAKCPNCGNLL